MPITDKISEGLVRLVSFDYLVVKKIIRKFIDNKDTKSILDLGCGTGYLAPLFSKSSYLGIDIDKNLISYAKKHQKGYSFLHQDATKVKLRKKFDIVLVVGVIHHLNDKDAIRFVDTIKSHLKSSGKVLIIEAVPPLFPWNIPGQILRYMDKGSFIRKLDNYEKFLNGKLKIEESYNQIGGFADYGVFWLSAR